jgi:hypothetical protein
MSSLKFKNPGEQHVRVALLTGHIADFGPGETHSVPESMRADCLAANLTLVVEKELTAKERKAAAEAAAKAAAEAEAAAAELAAGDDDESTVNAG